MTRRRGGHTLGQSSSFRFRTQPIHRGRGSHGRASRRSSVDRPGGGSLLVAACTAPDAEHRAGPRQRRQSASQATSGTLGAAPAASEPAQPQPKLGGTLRAVKTGDIAPIDPHYHSPGNGLGAWILYDTLTGYDDNLKPVPFLAESWDQSADQRTMKLSLRKGVTFHTGRDLTADDIIYNLNRLSDPKANTAGIIPGFVPPGTTWQAQTNTPWLSRRRSHGSAFSTSCWCSTSPTGTRSKVRT